MTDPSPPRPVVRVSVFVKLIAIMLAMALSLLVIVFFFFNLLIGPNLSVSQQHLEDYARVVAASEPDLAEARRIAARLHVEMRYEAPQSAPTGTGAGGGTSATDGTNGAGGAARSWTTDETLPAVAVLRKEGTRGRVYLPGGREYYLVRGPSGGTYAFFWDFRKHMYDAHVTLLWLSIAAMVAIVAITYLVLRRLLHPLRGLGEGVARLGDGQLDIVLPHRTRDEFGVLTQAFNQMVGRVRQMIRARDQLLLDVSHELRSPLTRLKVALALLPEAPPDVPSGGELRARIAADVAEMEAMIAELLELERLRDGRGLRMSRQPLLPLLRDVAALFQDRPPGVRVVADAHAIELDLDADKLRTVLRNLLENAIKYSLPDSRAVEASVAPKGDVVVVRVRDDGPGIPEEDVAHLFEPFFRVDRSRSKKTGGYGLGLSICRRIVEAHGGTITVERGTVERGTVERGTVERDAVERGVETAAGRGASFILTFPLPKDGRDSSPLR